MLRNIVPPIGAGKHHLIG